MFSDIGEKIEDMLQVIPLTAIVCALVYIGIGAATARERAEQLEKARQDIIELQPKLMEAHNELDSAMHELAELRSADK